MWTVVRRQNGSWFREPMNWFLPNVPRTHKKIALDLVVVMAFGGDKLVCERIYWDHVAVLR
jgi:hypothetical protein